MQYRKFPLITNLDISALGLGCMRLPTIVGYENRVDEQNLDTMITAAEEEGINYLDTAYIYHEGGSERALGATLERLGNRDKFYLATKSPVWMVNTNSDWDRLLNEQLERLRTDHIDFYLLHSLGLSSWTHAKELGVLPALEKAKAAGKIHHIGFSFHDTLSSFKKIIDDYDAWEFCQIQFNYLDGNFQAGEEGLTYAAKRKIGVIVMEPLRGGVLASPPPQVKKVLESRPPYEWALRFVFNRPEVSLVLSGMGSVDQIRENSAVAKTVLPGAIMKDEMDLIDEVRKIYKAKEMVPCTTCGYCRPCPQGVPIPEIFSLYNSVSMFDNKNAAAIYEKAYQKGGDACTQCGECLPKCPQGINIPDHIREAHSFLIK